MQAVVNGKADFCDINFIFVSIPFCTSDSERYHIVFIKLFIIPVFKNISGLAVKSLADFIKG